MALDNPAARRAVEPRSLEGADQERVIEVVEAFPC